MYLIIMIFEPNPVCVCVQSTRTSYNYTAYILYSSILNQLCRYVAQFNINTGM